MRMRLTQLLLTALLLAACLRPMPGGGQAGAAPASPTLMPTPWPTPRATVTPDPTATPPHLPAGPTATASPRPALTSSPRATPTSPWLSLFSAPGVNTAALSPDGARLALGGRGGSVSVVDVEAGALGLTLDAGPQALQALAFSPDGARLATGGRAGLIQVWDLASGRPERSLAGHTSTVQGLAFSPDGARLASAGADGTLRLWDAASGAALLTLGTGTSPYWSVAFSPLDGGALLAAGAGDNSLQVWESLSGTLRFSLAGHAGPVWSVAFSPDGKWLASGSSDGTARVWRVADGAAPPPLESDGGITWAVVFSPDSRALFSAGADGLIRQWKLLSEQRPAVLQGHTGPVLSLSVGGGRLASAGEDGTVRLWAVGPRGLALPTQMNVPRAAYPPPTAWPTVGTLQPSARLGPARWVSWSPDASRLALSGPGLSLRVHDTAAWAGQLEVEQGGHASFGADGRQLVLVTEDGVSLLDSSTGQSMGQPHAAHGSAFLSLSADGRRAAFAGAGGTAEVWDTSGGQTLFSLEALRGSVLCAAFSPDSRYLAALSLEASADGLGGDARARVWRLESGELVAEVPAWPAAGLALSAPLIGGQAGGTWLAAASSLLHLALWDVSTGDLLFEAAMGAPPGSLALSPDGRWLAASESGLGRVLIFDAGSGRRVYALEGVGEVGHLAFSPDGGRLAAASEAGSLVWDLP